MQALTNNLMIDHASNRNKQVIIDTAHFQNDKCAMSIATLIDS